MATREFRLNEFNQGEPPQGQRLQLLCEDNSGTYLLPFACEYRDGAWHNPKGPVGSKPIEAKVVGWRTWRF